MLYLSGGTINILAGFVIAMGVVVDDAIISVRELCSAPASITKGGRATIHGEHRAGMPTKDVRQAIIHATLIDSAVVLIPIFFIGGVMRQLFNRWRSRMVWRCWRHPSWS